MKYFNLCVERLIKYLITFLLIIFSFSVLYAQIDDPNVDRIPEKFINFPRDYSPNSVVTVDDYDNFIMGYDYSEGHVSMNPRNPLWYFCAYNMNGAHYTINGYDWLNSTVSFPSVQGDPVTAYDSLGNLYYQTMKYPISGCWVAKSTSNGQNWIYTNMTCVSGIDKNWIAADQTNGPYSNYVYCTMTAGYFWRSTDIGTSFAQTTQLSPQTLPGMMVCVGANGNISGGCVYVVTHSGTNSAGTYNFFKSLNGGATFSSVSTLSVSNYIGTEVSGRSCIGVMRTRPYPMIAADNSRGPYRGRLYLVWASNNPAGNGNKSDIWIKYSADQGSTWSTTMRINDDANPTANHSFFPAIWCDKESGKLYVEYYDTRLCPTSDSMDVYATFSTTGGTSFVPSQRLTNKTFKIDLPGHTAPSYQGDYFSITSNNKAALGIWNDFRNANANSYGSFSAYFPDFGMRLLPATDSLNPNGSVTIQMQVPSVKLYTDTVIVSAIITPTPPTGSLTITYPSGTIMTAYPGTVPVKITAAGDVTLGSYSLEVTAKGPNGTPVHKRTASIKVSSFVQSLTINLTALLSGRYNGTTMVPDTVNVELRNTTAPYTLVESKTVSLNASGVGNPTFTAAVNGTPYYIVLKFNNGIETWSATPQTFSGSALNYNFTSAATQAYGSNMKLIGTKWCVYVGDVNQDGAVDLLDMIAVDNDVANFVTGNVVTDLNGDLTVDLLDMIICDNNVANFVAAIKPPGALINKIPRTYEQMKVIEKYMKDRFEQKQENEKKKEDKSTKLINKLN